MSTSETADCRSMRAYLASYRRAERGIALRLSELRRLQSLEQEIGAAVAKRSSAVSRIRSLEAEAAGAVSDLCALRLEIESTIDRLRDDVLREVLHRHYIEAETFGEIAAALHYTVRHVSRLHKKALECLLSPTISDIRDDSP